MDNRRLFMLLALGIVCYMLFNAWMDDYGPKPAPTHSQPAATQNASAQPSAPATQVVAAPNAPDKQTGATQSAPADTTAATPAQTLLHGQDIVITTDTMQVTLDTAGGTIARVALVQYGQSEKPDAPPVQLLHPEADHQLILQTGLRGLTPTNTPLMFTSPASHYTLQQGDKTLNVTLTWQGQHGVTVAKTYTFHRGQYVVDLHYDVTNASGETVSVTPFARFITHYVPVDHSIFSMSRYTYTGPSTFNGNDYAKHTFDDLNDKAFSDTAAGGWSAMVNQYFMAVVIPPAKAKAHYYAKNIGHKLYQSGLVLSQRDIQTGAQADINQRLFLGPKLQDRLADIAPGLPRTVDYGKVTIIAQPMYKILEGIHYVVGNWGWSILLLVFLMKLLFFPLFQKSGKSMAKMRKFQPRIKAIQKRYKDDRQRQSQAMMELYKKEKINPIGGCLPMLLYFPIYFGLYYVLIYSVELRHAPFIFWMTDLSSPDPYHILPFIYGIANFAQMHVNPKPADKMQARLMMLMPIGVIAFSFIMPVGLVLYWIANAVLTTLQQWHINRSLGEYAPNKR